MPLSSLSVVFIAVINSLNSHSQFLEFFRLLQYFKFPKIDCQLRFGITSVSPIFNQTHFSITIQVC